MTRQRHPRHSRSETPSEQNPAAGCAFASFFPESAHDRLKRSAELIASGEVPLGNAADAKEIELLLPEVGRRRRDRLVTFIAHAIAHDIVRSRGP